MSDRIELSWRVLREFVERRRRGEAPPIDRPEVVSHATLSALAHHWPSEATPELQALLEASSEIRVKERSRWMTQRRIAVAELARAIGRDRLGGDQARVLPG